MTLTVDTAALDELNTKLAKELHILMGKLHSCGISGIVDLPQIVVIGEQGAGKSSVLEAISGVRFPVAAELCTRFATEISLYKTDHSRVNVRIRCDDDTKVDTAFDESGVNKQDLPGLIDKAKECMGIGIASKNFSKDVLCVTMEGPELTPLTLVDLPGLFRVGGQGQTKADIETVNYLTDRYMTQKKSIMLVVVEAHIDIVRHDVLAKVEAHDQEFERSLGVITKPDLATGHQMTAHIHLAKNLEPEYNFKLGWHVLRNRAEGEKSLDSRDDIESAFFASSMWNTVDQGDLGIASLREKLSSILYNHTRTCLPGVIRDIEQNLERRQKEHDELGPKRSDPKDMRSFLLRIAVEFQRLTRDANSGHYADGFFGELTSPRNRLRAELRGFHRAFDYIVKTRGYTLHIEEVDEKHSESEKITVVPDSIAGFLATNSYDFPLPKRVSRKVLNARLESLATATEGRELPGACNSELAVYLFKIQAFPWRTMAQFHIQRVTDAAKDFVGNLLAHIIGSKNGHLTADAIQRKYVDGFFTEREMLLEQQLNRLLAPYMEGYAVPLDAEFREIVDRWAVERMADRLQSLSLAQLAKPHPFGPPQEERMLSAAAKVNQSVDGGTYATEKIIDMMQAYYEMSRRTFTENIMNLAIEGCLIQDLPTIFTPLSVGEMDDERLKELASEPPSAHALRSQLGKEIETLQEGLNECRLWRRRAEPVKQQPIYDANIRTIAGSLWLPTDSPAKLPDLPKTTAPGQLALPGALPAPTKTSLQDIIDDIGKSLPSSPGSGENKATPASATTNSFGTSNSTNNAAPVASGTGSLFSGGSRTYNKAPLTLPPGTSSLFSSSNSTSNKTPLPFALSKSLFGAGAGAGSSDSKAAPAPKAGTGLFGSGAGSSDIKAAPAPKAGTGLFGSGASSSDSKAAPAPKAGTGLFGSGTGSSDNKAAPALGVSASLFGGRPAPAPKAGTGLFGSDAGSSDIKAAPAPKVGTSLPGSGSSSSDSNAPPAYGGFSFGTGPTTGSDKQT